MWKVLQTVPMNSNQEKKKKEYKGRKKNPKANLPNTSNQLSISFEYIEHKYKDSFLYQKY